MQLIELQENIWVIQGGANIGVIAHEGHCLIIDSGMDKDTGQKILNQVKKLGLTPTALLITHAHADHFGGAHYLFRQTGLQVYASRVEASVMSAPILEPLYLFGGAQPPGELQHKFFLAKPCQVDVILKGNELSVDQIPLEVIPLPGHSTEQVGVAYGDTLFVGDAFLTPDILDKHHIPFYTDILAGLSTLGFLKAFVKNTGASSAGAFTPLAGTMLKTKTTPFEVVVAGHGELYSSSDQVNHVIDYTAQRLESILDEVRNSLAYGEARGTSDVLRSVSTIHGASITTLSQHALYNTTIQAALSALYTQDVIRPVFQDNRLLWQRSH
ncbi:MAG TPA: MBL fold metallo-hydrolase [Ktedonobacteraceae bacterium]|nr:MBL fold metallo-hydrolase [Ktedonobacteraceae bacterium]